MDLLYLNFHGTGPIFKEIDDEERACWLDLDFVAAVLDLARDRPHVRLTVDDGNISDYEHFLPALRRRGLRATFFICSDRLGQPTYLNQDHVRELVAEGMHVGSHGAAHVSWRKLSPHALVNELVGSRESIEGSCGIRIESAACPLGAYDRRVLAGLRQAGYRHVYTSDGGLAREHQWLRARTSLIRSTRLADVERLIRHGPGAWKQMSISLRKTYKQFRPPPEHLK